MESAGWRLSRGGYGTPRPPACVARPSRLPVTRNPRRRSHPLSFFGGRAVFLEIAQHIAAILDFIPDLAGNIDRRSLRNCEGEAVARAAIEFDDLFLKQLV